jgi:hypothetical protein
LSKLLTTFYLSSKLNSIENANATSAADRAIRIPISKKITRFFSRFADNVFLVFMAYGMMCTYNKLTANTIPEGWDFVKKK